MGMIFSLKCAKTFGGQVLPIFWKSRPFVQSGGKWVAEGKSMEVQETKREIRQGREESREEEEWGG